MANNWLAMLVEMARPQIARFEPFNFNIKMEPVALNDPSSRAIEISSPIFGGLKATAELAAIDVVTNNAKALADEILSRIEKAIHQIEEEAELIAIVDYRWPKAA